MKPENLAEAAALLEFLDELLQYAAGAAKSRSATNGQEMFIPFCAMIVIKGPVESAVRKRLTELGVEVTS